MEKVLNSRAEQLNIAKQEHKQNKKFKKEWVKEKAKDYFLRINKMASPANTKPERKKNESRKLSRSKEL